MKSLKEIQKKRGEAKRFEKQPGIQESEGLAE